MSEIPNTFNPTDNLSEPIVKGSLDDLDRARLNELIQTSEQSGQYFGRGIELTDHDRQQFDLIATRVETDLEPMYEDPDWKAFMGLVDEGNSKGVLLSFVVHEGTSVPTWCIDGGEDPAVKKIMRRANDDLTPAIQVPTRIFNLYHWKNTVESLRRYETKSDESIRGTSPRPLGFALKSLAAFVKQTDQGAE